MARPTDEITDEGQAVRDELNRHDPARNSAAADALPIAEMDTSRCRYCGGELAAIPVVVRTQRTSIGTTLLEESRIGTFKCTSCGAPRPIKLSQVTRDDYAE